MIKQVISRTKVINAQNSFLPSEFTALYSYLVLGVIYIYCVVTVGILDTGGYRKSCPMSMLSDFMLEA